jgi:hypothetical protein
MVQRSLTRAQGGPLPGRPYFDRADWLWEPIRAAPVLDRQSAAMVDLLKQGFHGANLWDFGVTLRGPEQITQATPRYNIEFAKVPEWGPDPFGSDTMPIPAGTPVPPGSDGHVAIADPITNQTYNLWQAVNKGSKWSASWGAKAPLDGDGREPECCSSTGAGLARYAAVVRVSEIGSGRIPHALFFSTNMAAADFRYPAPRSDGMNLAKVATPIPEGGPGAARPGHRRRCHSWDHSIREGGGEGIADLWGLLRRQRWRTDGVSVRV